MLSVKTHTSPLAAVLPIAAVQATVPEANPGQPSFAKMLHDRQAPAPAPAPASVAPRQPAQAAHDHKPAETKAPAPAQATPTRAPPAAAARPTQPAREPAEARDAARSAAKATEAHDDKAGPRSVDGTDEAEDKDDPSVSADPALADWLAGLKLPDAAAAAAPLPAPAPAADPASGTRAETTATTATPLIATGTTSDPAQAAVTLAAGSAAIVAAGGAAVASNPAPAAATTSAGRSDANRSATDGSTRNTGTGPRGAAGDGSETSLLMLAAKADAPGGQPGAGAGGGDTGRPDRGTGTPAWSPLSSIAASASTPTAFMPTALNNVTSQAGPSTAQPVAVNLPTPVYSPDFPQAMGAQLTVLAQGGVEHAELHLNPADMGPVSVQIAIEGAQARIDFGADVASTRQAIEASLPELASALRDAGLTLSGGGVSQHSRSRQDMADAQGTAGGRIKGGSHGDGGTSIDNTAPAPLRRSVRVGGVDAYA